VCVCVCVCVCVPVEIIKAVESGVDVFESSYAYSAAEFGLAVVFGKRLDKGGSANERSFEIDLNDKKYVVHLYITW